MRQASHGSPDASQGSESSACRSGQPDPLEGRASNLDFYLHFSKTLEGIHSLIHTYVSESRFLSSRLLSPCSAPDPLPHTSLQKAQNPVFISFLPLASTLLLP